MRWGGRSLWSLPAGWPDATSADRHGGCLRLVWAAASDLGQGGRLVSLRSIARALGGGALTRVAYYRSELVDAGYLRLVPGGRTQVAIPLVRAPGPPINQQEENHDTSDHS